MAANPKRATETEPEDLLAMIEFIVMSVVGQLERAYGMSVFESIQEVYPRMSFGSVYTSLERLAWKGYLETELGEPEPVRGGRARKYYRLTDLGTKVLASTRTTIKAVGSIESTLGTLTPVVAAPGRGKP